MSVLKLINHNIKQGKKSIAVLIDPDKHNKSSLEALLSYVNKNDKIHYLFIGGSYLFDGSFEQHVQFIKENSSKPLVIFPGSPNQISKNADALMVLSVLSGRNAETLIGQLVGAVPSILNANIETLSTGYILIDGGRYSTVSYMSGSRPIPHHCDEIASSTAIAGAMLGNQMIYLDAGSGAIQKISIQMVEKVRSHIKTPLIIGGGIKNKEDVKDFHKAGADIVVIGNSFEENPALISSF